MNDDREVSPDMAALLGALADDKGAGDGVDALGDDERARLEAEMGSRELRQELASHRALVSELRAMPGRAPSPDWRALEVLIRQACDEVPAPRRWSWAALREMWRWPAVAMGAAAMASLALLLWQRAPRPVEPMRDAAVPATPAVPAPIDAGAPPAETPIASAPLYLDEEALDADEIDEAGVSELMRQLPAAAAIALGAAEPGDGGAPDADDPDELAADDAAGLLLPGDSFDDELERMDAEALRALDQWLEAEQKG